MLLEAQALLKRYTGQTAVNGISFSIRSGEILGYLGPNGSGKSTTVKMLTGLMQPTLGRILLDGRDINTDLASYKRRLGYVPEEPNLYPYLSGKEYLQLMGTLREIEPALLDRRIEELLRLFGLTAHRFSPVGSYSKGMRQKILIISALLHDPDIYIFDEPLSGLDVTAASIFRQMTQCLAREGKLIFYCSHVLEVVEKICTHVLILSKGNCVAHDSVERLRQTMADRSLAESFHHLVEGPDTESLAREIVSVMRSA